MVSTSGGALSSITIGESVDLKVNFTTTNLPSSASYTLNFEVNGLILSSGPLTLGAGGSGTQSWTENSGSFSADFTATPGANQAIATIDQSQSVAETSYSDNTFSFNFNASGPVTGSLSYNTAQMRQAYGIGNIPNFGSAPAIGTGQTVAIVDAYNDPTVLSDLDGFDQSMALTTTSNVSLYQQFGPASSFLSVYNQTGQNITANIATSGSNGVPQQDDGWDGEITLDVQWVHSIAPGAKIILVEADSASGDLDTAEAAAAKLPGVSVISNSWGGGEYSGESSEDPYFVTPAGHIGVTFLVSTGDSGAPGSYPAYSPTVVAVGGTELTLASNGYGGETGWSYPAPQPVKNGSSSYSQSGNWTAHAGGYSGSYSTATGGSSATASWTTTNLTGNDEVSATWVASPSNATNATYSIYDGTSSSGTLLGTVTVDQTKAPVGIASGNAKFQDLGVFASGSGSLTVVLSASGANGKVVADAIGTADASAGGGGISQYEAEPAYQQSVQNTGFRTNPDVSFDASVNSGVTFYENGSLNYGIAGTSLACPCWAGLVAIINQGRLSIGGQTLNSGGNDLQALQAIYSLPASDFHDVTAGYNGYAAGPGYDESTGIGSPITNLLVPDLVAYGNQNQLAVATQPPSIVTAGAPFGFTVAVENPNGAPVNNYNGPVTISLGSDPGSTTLGGTLTVNAVNGVATFSGLTLDVAAAGYTINVKATGLASGLTPTFTVVAAAPSQLVVSSEPASVVTAGSPFGLSVSVEDAFGNLATNDSGTVTIVLANTPGGTSLGGTTTVASVNGVATFSGLTLTKAGSGYTLSFTRSGLAGATSTPITVNPGAPQRLAVIQAPQSSVVAGGLFSLEVAIEDLYGNPETIETNAAVTASLIVGSGPLQGNTTVNLSNGIASFTGLSDTKAVAIKLQFSSPNLSSVNSGYINITPGPASQLVVQNQPSPTATVGQPFLLQPLIYEEDSFGNLISSDNSSVVTVSLASGSGSIVGTSTAVIQAGAARFSNLEDLNSGTIALKFATGSLPSVNSNPIVVTRLVPTIAIATPGTTVTYKQSATFTASLTPASGGPIPTGSVVFLDGSTILGTSPLNASGVATFTTTGLSLGTQAITATYTGDTFNASVSSPSTPVYVGDLTSGDFSGSGKSSLAVFGLIPSLGKYGFTIVTTTNGASSTSYFTNNGYGYGNAQSIPVVGDFFGDGRASYALWTPNALGGMTFTAVSAVSGKGISVNFGGVNDLPVVADVDGDGKADFGVYGYQQGLGYRFDFVESSHNFSANAQYVFNNNGYGYGNAQSIPVVGDFDGSGKAGFGVYTPSASGSTFAFVDPSTNISFLKTISPSLGTVNDIPMAVEYDGDGKADLALYGPDPSHAGQYRYLVLTSTTGFNPAQAVVFNNNGYGYGNASSIPVMANYDGTGKADFAVFTPDFNGGAEFVYQTNQVGQGVISDFATLTEIPLTAPSYLIARKVRGY